MDTSTTLPTSRPFLTSLIDNLTTDQQTNSATNLTQNCLKNAPPHLKSILLTLHVLFPNELLPALDVLDRNLVTRLHLKNSLAVPPIPLGDPDRGERISNEVYLVR